MMTYPTGWAKSKRTGGTSEFILMCPIKSGRIPGERQTYEQRLRSILASLDERINWGGEIALSHLPTLHFARFSIIMPHNYLLHSKIDPPLPTSTGWENPKELRTWLLVVAVFDGPASLYNRDLTALIGRELNRIFGHCTGYPGTDNSDLLWMWFQSYQLSSSFFYSAYPGLSVVRIKYLETFKRHFDAFLARVRPRNGNESSPGLCKIVNRCFPALSTWFQTSHAKGAPPDTDAELDRLVAESNQYHDDFPSDDGTYPVAEDKEISR